MRRCLYCVSLLLLVLLALSQVEDGFVIKNFKLEVLATLRRQWQTKPIDNNPPPANSSLKSVHEDACNLIVEDPRWQALSQQVWKRNNRTMQAYPSARVDPIVMLKDTRNISFSKPFAMCTIAKNGCSRWRRLLRRMMGYENFMVRPHDPRTNGLMYAPDVGGEALEKLFRWAIVRDPHERLVSAWSEKCNSTAGEPDYNCGDWIVCENKHDFKTFVRCLWDKYNAVSAEGNDRERLCEFNEHFRPQMCDCNLKQLRYDVLLPVEYIDAWYHPLVKCLRMGRYTKDFWGKNRPFYSKRVVSVGSHSTHAASKMKKLYTKELYDYVAEIYRDDLIFNQHMVSFD